MNITEIHLVFQSIILLWKIFLKMVPVIMERHIKIYSNIYTYLEILDLGTKHLYLSSNHLYLASNHLYIGSNDLYLSSNTNICTWVQMICT